MLPKSCRAIKSISATSNTVAALSLHNFRVGRASSTLQHLQELPKFETGLENLSLSLLQESEDAQQCQITRMFAENQHTKALDSSLCRLRMNANQLGVNRPVEDRWNAATFHWPQHRGEEADEEAEEQWLRKRSSELGISGTARFGSVCGHLFSVIDGHLAANSAHAINNLHQEYLIYALMRHHSESSLQDNYVKPARQVEPQHYEEQTQAKLADQTDYITRHQLNCAEFLRASEEALRDNIFYRPLIESHLPRNSAFSSLHPRLRHVHAVLLRHFLTDLIRLSDCRVKSKEDEDKEVTDSESDWSQTLRVFGDTLNRIDLDTLNAVSSAMTSSSSTPNESAAVEQLEIDRLLLRTVFAGSVGVFVYIPDAPSHSNSQAPHIDLYLAQIGDCQALLLTTQSDVMSACPSSLSHFSVLPDLRPVAQSSPPLHYVGPVLPPHNAFNPAEVARLLHAHPRHEHDTLLRDNRLLAELAPLRAFGNVRFKWPAALLHSLGRQLRIPPTYSPVPRFYHSPPYLSALPEMRHLRLDASRHRHWLVLASDGLWDKAPPDQVAAHLAQLVTSSASSPLTSSSSSSPAASSLSSDNYSTRLIQNALVGGGDDDQQRALTQLLSIPARDARLFRDDITVLVVELLPK